MIPFQKKLVAYNVFGHKDLFGILINGTSSNWPFKTKTSLYVKIKSLSTSGMQQLDFTE